MDHYALTVHEPWASLLVAGVKRVENRVWRTKHRGRLYIHASKNSGQVAQWSSGQVELPPSATRLLGHLATFPYGCILGHVELIDCVRVEDLGDDYPQLLNAEHRPFVCGPWCWVMAPGSAVRFDEPVPAQGRQQLWAPPAGCIAATSGRASDAA